MNVLNKDERRAVIRGGGVRALSAPLYAFSVLVVTSVTVAGAGDLFTRVSIVATLALLIPFADLGLGAIIFNFCGVDAPQVRVQQIVYSITWVLGCMSVLISAVAMLAVPMNLWSRLLNSDISHNESIVYTMAVILFAVNMPLLTGSKILIARNRNHHLSIISVAAPLVSIVVVLVFAVQRAWPPLYCLPLILGYTVSNTTATVMAWRSLRLTLCGFVVNWRVRLPGTASIMPMMIITVGLPISSQVGRLQVQENSASELSSYILSTQLCTAVWSVLATAAAAFWPAFSSRRGNFKIVYGLWFRSSLTFILVGILVGSLFSATLPVASSIVSGGDIRTSYSLAIMLGLLLVVQSAHVVSGMLLTQPIEMWLQALSVMFVTLSVLALGPMMVGQFGAVGATGSLVLSILIFHFVVDIFLVPYRLSRKRSVVGSSQPHLIGNSG
ncbi:hypothetical protein R4P47_13390 [Rhodococcus sp. IEGM 1370]|uniref:hypothetical protein n=1 Tax=Rhodococcus sp. IEGM 1370 TaxID=3082222 RepID=UPI00295421B1|nr:hypothetical protein [Rhodococcus sp. IEGM 1370]MDV8077556.1 hypothetical protein [Rhodococcus sp. IEGM 1370]